MVETINELSSLSRKLNAKSDKLNSIISATNTKLENLNLGIEAWLAEPVAADDPETTDDDGNPCEPWRSVTLLGYCPVEDKWQLAVKEAVLTEKGDARQGTWDEVSNSHSPRPLLKATRSIRTKAMDLIPRLLDEIKFSAEKTLASIEKAEKAAANL